MKNKPYHLISSHFEEIYPGGGCNVEQLRKNKRGKIKSFSRASQRKLCLTLDSIKDFTPELSISITLKEFIPNKSYFKEIKSFCRSYSKNEYTKKK